MIKEEEIQKALLGVRENLITSIKEVISISSVLKEDSSPYPFGEDIDKALKHTLKICDKLGFKTYYDPDGYYGYADIGGGDELVAVLGHLDVVPAGSLDTWKFGPFNPVIEDGKLYGRGTQDDKGPTITSIYAAKALMDLGVTFNKRLRFIFGTDEENLWRDMNRYIEKEELPSMGFAPDSTFPLIYAEKGLLQIILHGKNQSKVTLEGGNAFNSVPDNITYTGEKQEELKAKLEELSYQHEITDNGIKVLGKAAHAQATEKGINAISRLAVALKSIGVTSKAIDFIANEIREDPFGGKVLSGCEDEISGKLKFNIGKINIKEDETIFIDMRIPVTADKGDIVEKISKAAEKYGLSYKEHDWLKANYVPKDSFLIKTLLEVYQDVTKDTISEPITSGGATFARALKNCVAFGPILPGRPKVEHQRNEYIVLEDVFVSLEIYAKALYKLTR